MPLQISEQFVVRAPVLSARTIVEPLSSPTLPDGTLERLFADPLVQEAIFLASPALYDDAQRWVAGGLPGPAEASHVERSLLKYLIRMSTRATPFGLFATCSTGSFGQDGCGRLAPREAIRTTTRLDMDLVCQLAQRLSSSSDIRPTLRFYPNTTLYTLGPAIRFFEFWYDERRRRHYRLVSIETNRYLERALAEAGSGRRLEDIAARIADPEVSVEEALRYLNDLADNQVLVSELEPALTDTELLGALIDRLLPAEDGARAALSGINRALARLDAGPRNPPGAYAAIAASIDSLVPHAARDALFQVDAFRPGTLSLPSSVREQVLDALALLSRLSPNVPPARLEQFRTTFRERFEDRQVPLLLALDAEVGVAYGPPVGAIAPLLEGLELKPRTVPDLDAAPPLTGADRLLLSLIWQALEDGEEEVRLDPAAFAAWPTQLEDLPPTMSVAFSVISRGDPWRLLIRGAGGASAAAALGRFAHLDPGISLQVADAVAHEEALCGERLLADLLHLPEDRVGNVLLHPRFRQYEIPCLTRSAAPAESVVRLEDLFLSVPHAGPIQLWSARLQREIVPMLGNAHRYYAEELLPVYRLLGDLQVQDGRQGLGFPAETLLRYVPRLPRVVYNGCILSPARWRLTGEAIPDAVECLRRGAADTDRWRMKRRMPRRVRLALEDHELYLDLGNDRCRDLLATELRGKKQAQITEDLFDPDRPWITSSDGGYYHEVLATVMRARTDG